MRVKLKKNELDELFEAVAKQKIRWPDLALALKISERNLRDWRRGKVSMPQTAYLKCLTIAKFKTNNFKPVVLKEYWHIKEAAKKGGLARLKLYGNLGTAEGRRRGGLASVKSNFLRGTNFKKLRPIVEPAISEDLTELLGILMGDGHLSDYQIKVTTNSITDRQHAQFVKQLFVKQFNLPVALSFRKYENAVNVVVSSKNTVKFFSRVGMPIGHKINNNISVPAWVMTKPEYQKAFLRGLFDTDGCIYLDKHLIKGKLYKHMGWTITSYAGKLIEGIIKILRDLGFNPTYRVSQRSIYLRRQSEIKKYFTEIGTHNNKHQERYNKFCGEVPKWS